MAKAPGAAPERRPGFVASDPMTLHRDDEVEDPGTLPLCRQMDSLSLGGVAAMNPQRALPKKYRVPAVGEKSTFQGAGIVPCCRFEGGEVKILLWQPQTGNKKGVRWYDFGGRKETKAEYTSVCAARKFAKETYGIFGCKVELPAQGASKHLEELYQGLCNLPLMMHTSMEWAKLQLCNDDIRMFYNDIHEYHCYLLLVPFIDAEVLGEISKLVDGGKRVFRWLSLKDVREEVVAPRLHTPSFMEQIESLQADECIGRDQAYADGSIRPAAGAFTGVTVGRVPR